MDVICHPALQVRKPNVLHDFRVGRKASTGDCRSRRTLAGQNPDMSVVPGTEILARGEGGELIESMEDTRQKMAALKETILSPAEKVPDVSANQEAFLNLKDSLDLDTANQAISDILSKISDEISNIETGIVSAGSSTSVQLTSAIDTIQSSLGQLAQQIELEAGKDINEISNTLKKAQDSILDQVPPEARDILTNAFSAVDRALDAYSQNPDGYAMVISIILGVSLIISYSFIYGGYSGVFQPEQAMEVLQNKDAVLVDIRDERNRMENGVPLLKLGARGKGIVIPYPTLSSSILRQVSNSQVLLTDILAEQIKSISKISRDTIVIVMDSNGKISKDVSRACYKAGIGKVYIMDGGFAKYRRQGFNIDGREFYEDGPLAIAADRAETLTKETKSIAKNPAYAFAGISGLGTAIFALLHFHEVLRFVGVLGVEMTVVLRLLSYESSEDFAEDIQNLANSLRRIYNYPKSLIQTVAKSSKNASS